MKISVIKNLVAQILGITTQRPFPKFSNERIGMSTAPAQPSRPGQEKKRVIFLSDTFARYIEPQTEEAALQVLSHCGFDVHVLPVLGAGAALLSKGFVEAAQRHAARLLDLLDQADPTREAPVVSLEPPEIYTLKHDYLDLLPERTEEIAQRTPQVWLLDEFLLRSEEFNLLRVVTLAAGDKLDNEAPIKNVEIAYHRHASQSSGDVGPPRNDILFHPHCHQRAEGLSGDGLATGTQATVELLRSCGYDVELVDAGCCGMAGSFGYEAEHYELSMKIGELKLFPALRTLTALKGTSPKSDGGSVGFEGGGEGVVSTGAACRMQIQQGTGIEAVHPILLVQKRLEGIAAAAADRTTTEPDQG
jgi:Fe-S oxidoreductase